MKRYVLLLVAGLACIGCHARPKQYWFSPEKTLEAATRDCRECNRHAHAKAQEEHFLRYHESIEHDRPWQMDNEALESANREMDEAYYFGICMTSRGYREVAEFHLGAEIRTRSCFGGDQLQRLAGR